MQKVSSLVSRDIGDTLTNIRTWGGVMYNVLNHGLVGDGVTDDTAALQAMIDTAIAAGRKSIFFPHGTYFVTALVNSDQVSFFGDNAVFTGGYTGVIAQFGGMDNMNIDGGNFDDPYLNPVVNGGTF